MINQIVSVATSVNWHNRPHRGYPEWELLYCIAGSGSLAVSNQSFACIPGHLIVVPPYTSLSLSDDRDVNFCSVRLAEAALTETDVLVIQNEDTQALSGIFQAVCHFGEKNMLLSHDLANLLIHYVEQLNAASPHNLMVQKIIQVISAHLSDSSFELKDALASMSFSVDYITRIFRDSTGLTPHRYLILQRLQLAASLLTSSPEITISEVAHRSGFKDQLYFSRVFHQQYQFSPSEYRIRQLSSDASFPCKPE